MLHGHSRAQLKNRLLIGAGYTNNDLVIAREDGSPVHPETLSKSFTRLAQRDGMQNVHFHCLRHTAATTMIEGRSSPEGGQRNAGPLDNRHHPGHLQPGGPINAAGRRGEDGRCDPVHHRQTAPKG